MDNNDKAKSQPFDNAQDKKSKIKTDEEEKLDGEKIDELKKTIEELEDKYKRALADYQNLEKRVAEERKELIRRANKDLLLRFLPVLDTLMLAIKHIKTQDKGLSLSLKQFQDVLKGEGVEKIEVVGKQFDPNLMQCVETVTGEAGKVLDEIRPGYKLSNLLLRAALVKVGKTKAAS